MSMLKKFNIDLMMTTMRPKYKKKKKVYDKKFVTHDDDV
jgi:hypothetical protein